MYLLSIEQGLHFLGCIRGRVKSTCFLGLLDGVGGLRLDELEALLVLLGLVVDLAGLIGNKVPSASHAVVLPETWLVLLHGLVKQQGRHLWEQVLIDNLVEVTAVPTLSLVAIDCLVLGYVILASESAHDSIKYNY